MKKAYRDSYRNKSIYTHTYLEITSERWVGVDTGPLWECNARSVPHVKITLFVCNVCLYSKSSISKNRLRMLRNKIKKCSPLCSVLNPALSCRLGVFCIMCIPSSCTGEVACAIGRKKTQNKTNSNLNHRYKYWLTKIQASTWSNWSAQRPKMDFVLSKFCVSMCFLN